MIVRLQNPGVQNSKSVYIFEILYLQAKSYNFEKYLRNNYFLSNVFKSAYLNAENKLQIL